MSVTQQLLELFNVDKQLRGMRSSLETAEKFLSQQQTLLGDMDKQKTTLEAQYKQLQAVIANYEGESARLEVRVTTLREQMNTAKTAKEYNAFLAELNNYKQQRGEIEERGLEAIAKAEDVKHSLDSIRDKFGERHGITENARRDRDSKDTEIRDRVAALQEQRNTVAANVPPRERQMLEGLIKLRGDDAMAPIEVIDRRAHEYSCSSCMMAVTVEVVSAVMSGRVANCPSCRCLLYSEPGSMQDEEKPKKPRKAPAKRAPKKAKADAVAVESGAADADAPNA